MITLNHLINMKKEKEKIVMLTAYDASFTQVINKARVEIILVGDSLGMVIQGHSTTVPVSIEDIVYHTRNVTRVNNFSFILADLPYLSYFNKTQALENAKKLMQAGAMMVKIEGGEEWVQEITCELTSKGIPVCGHIGLTPQTVHNIGGFKIQGREEAQAEKIYQQAIELSRSGAKMLVLECMPEKLAARITNAINIPTIGIGAGPQCDGQVLVLYDMLGINGHKFKFVKNYLDFIVKEKSLMSEENNDATLVEQAISCYVAEVKHSSFPTSEHSFL